MNHFSRKLLTEWRKLELPFGGEKMLLAVSGGADSCALALALGDLKKRRKISNEFIIAHFNHALRGKESDKDEEFTKRMAEDLGFEFFFGRAEKGQIDPKSNTEQLARNARYEFLSSIANSENCYGVLTGHTVNDQSETFLLNLIRGSGIDGLAGMKSIRPLIDEDIAQEMNNFARMDNVSKILIRPMLNWATRNDTEKFVQSCGVSFRQDSMNLDTKYTRIRIRTDLIPKLREYNPKIVQTLARTADLLRNVANESTLSGVEITMGESLMLDELKKLSLPDLRKSLRVWLKERRGGLRRIGFAQVSAIENLIHTRKSGRMVELPGGERVIKQKGFLVFRKSPVEK